MQNIRTQGAWRYDTEGAAFGTTSIKGSVRTWRNGTEQAWRNSRQEAWRNGTEQAWRNGSNGAIESGQFTFSPPTRKRGLTLGIRALRDQRG